MTFLLALTLIGCKTLQQIDEQAQASATQTANKTAQVGTTDPGVTLPTCVSDNDCASGQTCAARQDGATVCMGNGQTGADCRNDKDCQAGLACTLGKNGIKTCSSS